MRAAWNPGDLPTRKHGHLRLVTSSEPASSLGAGRAGSLGAPVPSSLPRRGAHLSLDDLANLEQLAQLCARMEAANATLMKAVRKRDLQAAQEAARAILHIGLKAGDVSRHMERGA